MKTAFAILITLLGVLKVAQSASITPNDTPNDITGPDSQVQHTDIYVTPQQIHLALAGGDGNDMVVTWSTMNSTKEIGGSYVLYGPDPTNLKFRQNAYESEFVDGGKAKHKQYIHRATMTSLTPGKPYFYVVGCDITESNIEFFKALPYQSDPNWSPKLVLFGDMGNTNAQSLTRLQSDVRKGFYDMILHIGDFAYDMNSNEGHVGDEFMREIQPLASYLPYMTAPGNHESAYNFSHYKARFTMADRKGWHDWNIKDMFYSFNAGPMHIISVDTEYYYFLEYGTEMAKHQYEWLEADLDIANREENRRQRPWILIMGHRPMYCSGRDKDDCRFQNTRTRVGYPQEKMPGMEPLLLKYKVDLAIWAHEHNYERMWPMYNYEVRNGTKSPYHNAPFPIHLITGSAGCDEGREYFGDLQAFDAFRSSDYGYTRLTIHNGTHLEFNQVSDDQNGKIIDHFWVTKDPVAPSPRKNYLLEEVDISLIY